MIHLLETKQERSEHLHPFKRKVIEIIAALKTGEPMTASDIEDRCDVSSANVMSTLKLLQEFELVAFVGWGKRRGSGGHYPALWRWV